MNGGTGFRHKAAKGKPMGGRFKSCVNTVGSPPLSTQQTAHRTALLKGRVTAAFWKGPGAFSEHLRLCQQALDIVPH